MMTLSAATIGFALVILYICIFIIKLYRFHSFMIYQYPQKQYQAIFTDPEFSLEALVLSCLSLFLELFGHIFISLLSSLGYGLYIMQRNYVLIILGLGFVASRTCQYVSKYFGRIKFVHYVMPSLRLEGVILSILTSTLFSYFFFLIAQKTDGEFLISQISETEYMTFGITIGFLNLMGNLLTQFLRRCANL